MSSLEALGPEAATGVQAQARVRTWWAEQSSGGGGDWRHLLWDLPISPAGAQTALPPELGLASLSRCLRYAGEGEQALTAKPPFGMAEAWNFLPTAKTTTGVDGAGGGLSAPQSPIEKGVAAIWRRVLGLDWVGADDNFFELGGDSLITTQVHGQLHRQFGVQVPIEKLFEELTVAGQARVVDEAMAREVAESEEDILSRLVGMSDEEAERELARLTNQAPL